MALKLGWLIEAAQRVAVQLPRALPTTFKKRTISRAKRSAGTAGWARWRMALACSQHERTTSARNHASTTSVRWNHPRHTITCCTTGKQHHGRSNHASTTGTGTTRLAQRASHPASAHLTEGQPITLPQPPNGLPLSCAATDRSEWRSTDTSLQKRVDLGAAQRRQLQRRVGLSNRYRNTLHQRLFIGHCVQNSLSGWPRAATSAQQMLLSVVVANPCCFVVQYVSARYGQAQLSKPISAIRFAQ